MTGQWPFVKSQRGTIENEVDNRENVRCQEQVCDHQDRGDLKSI